MTYTLTHGRPHYGGYRVANNLEPAVADRINWVAKRLGLRVRYVPEDSITDGAGHTANAQIRDKEVLVERNNPNPQLFLVGHEITHRMQELAPKEYRALRNFVAQIADVQEDAERKQRLYQGTYEEALDEATADYVGDMLKDGTLLDEFIEQHRNDRTLLEKLRDAFRAVVAKLTGAEKKAAQTAEDKLTAALEAAGKQAESLQSRDGRGTMGRVKNHLKGENDNGRETGVHRALGSDTGMAGTGSPGGAAKEERAGNGGRIVRYQDLAGYERGKVNEIILTAVDESPAWRGVIRSISISEAAERIFDGYLDGTSLVFDMRQDIPGLTKALEKAVAYANRNKEGGAREKSGGDTSPSGQYDSTGRELTQAQADYFQNSKARDAGGNLIPLYHGSRYDTFTEFDMYEGVWLSESREYAEHYAETWESQEDELGAEVYADQKMRIYSLYANIETPADLGELNVPLSEKKVLSPSDKQHSSGDNSG